MNRMANTNSDQTSRFLLFSGLPSMLRYWLLLMVMMSGAFAQAQVTLYGGMGFHWHRVADHPVNKVIREYNTNRKGLNRPMQELEQFSGPSVAVGVGTERVTINLDMAWIRAQSTAIMSGTDAYRTGLVLSGYQGEVAFGAYPGPGDGLTVGFGISLVYAHLKAQATGTEAALQPFVGSPIDAFNYLGIAPTMQAFVSLTPHVSLYAKPYYLIDLYDNDYYSLQQAMNPATVSLQEADKYIGRVNQLGVQIGLVLVTNIGG